MSIDLPFDHTIGLNLVCFDNYHSLLGGSNKRMVPKALVRVLGLAGGSFVGESSRFQGTFLDTGVHTHGVSNSHLDQKVQLSP